LTLWDVATGKKTRSGTLESGIDRLYSSPGGHELWGKTSLAGTFAVRVEDLTAVAAYQGDAGVAAAKSVRADGTYGILRWRDNSTIGSEHSSVVLEWWRGATFVSRETPLRFDGRITTGAVSSDGHSF